MTSIASKTGGGLKLSWGAEHRTGYCENCQTILEETGEYRKKPGWEGRGAPIKRCPKCGGEKGVLISRQVSFDVPGAPSCPRPSCLWGYFKSVVFYVLLILYHEQRVAYAEAHRHDEILEKYRTGIPTPVTIRQALCANLAISFRR